MKHFLLLFACALFTTSAFAQIKAVTSSGEEVLLNNDGTWKYIGAAPAKKEIPTNSKPFFKAKDYASFLVMSQIVKGGVYLNPKKWTFKKGEEGGAAEFSFELKGKDAWGLMIPERIEIPLETLKGIAIENAKGAAPDMAVVNEEYRTVNGKKVLCMQMNGTVSGVPFTYLGYYYSSPHGVVQLLTYTSTNMVEEYRSDLEELLNGLEITD